MRNVVKILKDAVYLTTAIDELKSDVSKLQEQLEDHVERIVLLEAQSKSVKTEVKAAAEVAFLRGSMDLYSKLLDRLVELEGKQSRIELRLPKAASRSE